MVVTGQCCNQSCVPSSRRLHCLAARRLQKGCKRGLMTTTAREYFALECNAGVAAAKGVTTAAQVTLKVGGEALRAAAPVGKWALQQGGKAAFGLVVKSITGGGEEPRIILFRCTYKFR